MPHLRLSRGPVQFQSLEPLVYRDEPIGFVVHLSPRGFLIIPGWTEDSPMKFISFSGDFAALADHPFILQILDGLLYTKARLHYTLNEAHAAAFGAVADTLNADQAALNEANWARFLSDRATVQAASEVAAVAPLLASKWDEKSPFNQYAPKIGTRTPYAGAAAVAQAQLMYFWKHPTTGEGSHSYTWSYYLNNVLYSKTLSADFNHEYYWDRMIDDYYSVVPTTEQKDAVARLMSDVGISIDMNYSLTGSFTDTNAKQLPGKTFSSTAPTRLSCIETSIRPGPTGSTCSRNRPTAAGPRCSPSSAWTPACCASTWSWSTATAPLLPTRCTCAWAGGGLR